MEDKLLNEEPAAAQTAENYRRVCDEIAEAAYKAGRDPSEIRLVGATKFKTCAEILPALKAGLAEVGENRAQEFRDKFDFFTAQGVRPHFIGALQTNKAKYVVGKAELIQSVDRLALAEEINRLAQKAGLVQPGIGLNPHPAVVSCAENCGTYPQHRCAFGNGSFIISAHAH